MGPWFINITSLFEAHKTLSFDHNLIIFTFLVITSKEFKTNFLVQEYIPRCAPPCLYHTPPFYYKVVWFATFIKCGKKSQISQSPPLISSQIFNHFQKFKVPALCKLFQTGYSFIKWVELNAVLDYPSIRLSLESFNWGEHGLVIWYFCTILFYPFHLLNLISFHFIINTEYVQACSICLSNRAPKLSGWFWGLYT